MLEGGCHCGAVRYKIEGEALHSGICHCSDCRRHSGAPMVHWMMVRSEQASIAGELAQYASSEHGRRKFCPQCGTSLFYENAAALPDLLDVQAATLDNADAAPPRAHIQMADALHYFETLANLPKFDRFPEE